LQAEHDTELGDSLRENGIDWLQAKKNKKNWLEAKQDIKVGDSPRKKKDEMAAAKKDMGLGGLAKGEQNKLAAEWRKQDVKLLNHRGTWHEGKQEGIVFGYGAPEAGWGAVPFHYGAAACLD